MTQHTGPKPNPKPENGTRYISRETPDGAGLEVVSESPARPRWSVFGQLAPRTGRAATPRRPDLAAE